MVSWLYSIMDSGCWDFYRKVVEGSYAGRIQKRAQRHGWISQGSPPWFFRSCQKEKSRKTIQKLFLPKADSIILVSVHQRSMGCLFQRTINGARAKSFLAQHLDLRSSRSTLASCLYLVARWKKFGAPSGARTGNTDLLFLTNSCWLSCGIVFLDFVFR